MKQPESSTIGVTVQVDSTVKDVMLSFDHDTPVAGLRDAIGRNLAIDVAERALLVERTGKILDVSACVYESDLLHGDVIALVDMDRVSRPTARLVPKRTLTDLKIIGVAEGETVLIGRSVAGPNTIRLADRTVSGRHAELTWDSTTGLGIKDLGSRNGVWVNEQQVDGSVPIVNGDVIEFGDNSVFVVEFPYVPGVPSHLSRSGGFLRFSRPPRVMNRPAPALLELGPAPERPKRRRLPLPMIVSPVVLGVVMFLLLKSPTYLLFTAMGPIMAFWNWIDARKGAARDYREAAAAYARRLEKVRKTLGQAREHLLIWQSSIFPDPSGTSRVVQALSTRLWECRPSHPDFLELRLGRGDLPSENSVEVTEGGEADLIEEALALKAEFGIDHNVPVTVALSQHAVFGLVGDDSRVLTRWLITQIAAKHSPRDLVMTFLAPEHEKEWAWTKWLPHVAEAEHLGVLPLPKNSSETRQAFKALRDLVTSRREASAARWQADGLQSRSVVVIAEPPFDLKAAEVSLLLQDAGSVGLSVIWLAESESMLPGECSAMLRIDGSTATLVDIVGGSRIEGVALDGMSEEDAARSARRLAPVRDVTAAVGFAGLPSTVGILSVLEVEAPTPDGIVGSWRSHGRDFVAPVGVDGSKTVMLDLAATGDGAHGLVAGTTGGGKSEFLRSLVAALAYRYPPTYLTFLFVDYKGGSAFRDCVDFPHTVGVLTNLDEGLADRARRSLAAELDYRQRLFDRFGVQDLDQMRSEYPEDAPPYLLVIFDEFASLVQEIPEFVDGVVDIAQRGRSLGMHLILATQTPGGVINPKIQNCVNFRVAFRLREATESNEVIKASDAENIPAAFPGRGYLRAGDNSLTLFQAAYAMSRLAASEAPPAVAHTMVFEGPGGAAQEKTIDESLPTDLRRIVDAAREAAAGLGYRTPRRPWLPELPPILDLCKMVTPDVAGDETTAVVGIADLPDRQAQVPYQIRFSEVRNVLIFGGGGSGKTTALRSIALSLAASVPADRVNVYGFDFASRGLPALEALPHVGGIAQGNDISRVRNLLAMLQSIVEHRRGEPSTGETDPDVVVLIDGLVPLLASLETLDGGCMFQGLQQLVVDGPAVGVYFVIATDQPQRVPSTIANVVGERIVFRLTNRDAYATAGVDTSTSAMLAAPGRSWSARVSAVVQIAAAGTSESVDESAQLQAIAELAARTGGKSRAPTLRVLPERVEPDQVDDLGLPAGSITLGLDDECLEPVVVDFGRAPSLLVVGPALSGKTATLRWIRDAFRRDCSSSDAIYITPSGIAVGDTEWSSQAVGWDEGVEMLESIAENLHSRKRWLLIAIDDADDLAEVPIGAPRGEQMQFQRFSEPLEKIIKHARGHRVAIVAAGRFPSLTRLQGWGMRMRREEQALMLATVGLGAMSIDPLFGARIPRRSDYRPAAGRGVLIRKGSGTFMQVVWPGEPGTTAGHP